MNEIKVSIYQRQTGGYTVSYINPLTQKRKRRDLSSKKDAERYKAEVLVQHSKGQLPSLEKVYVGQLLKAHLQKYPNSKIAERKNLFKSFHENFAHFEINQLTKQALELWLTKLKEENNYTEKNMGRIKTLTNAFFRWLLDEEIILSNPLERIKYSQNLAPKRASVILTENEVAEILDRLKEYSPTVLYSLIYVIIHTGCRRSEALNLEWGDVDFKTREVVFRQTKNGTNRRVKMSQKLYDFLCQKPEVSDYVLPNEQGRKFERMQVQRSLKRFKEAYPSEKDWRLHDLRHSFAWNFLKKGGELYQLKAVLGHKSIQMTCDLYGHLEAHHIESPSPFDL